eukprot:TRINITY_DN75427_c0_g1_i1.p1 TRINITY_DN75427_c0_g1~~TRINITY_DN75427_c0_g1_i1.p1  ORF type:complete len:742 (-),score=103.04 TRINITY_DN75427_c0_g1_i1:110-2164(-)
MAGARRSHSAGGISRTGVGGAAVARESKLRRPLSATAGCAASAEARAHSVRCEAQQLDRKQRLKEFHHRCQRRVVEWRSSDRNAVKNTATNAPAAGPPRGGRVVKGTVCATSTPNQPAGMTGGKCEVVPCNIGLVEILVPFLPRARGGRSAQMSAPEPPIGSHRARGSLAEVIESAAHWRAEAASRLGNGGIPAPTAPAATTLATEAAAATATAAVSDTATASATSFKSSSAVSPSSTVVTVPAATPTNESVTAGATSSASPRSTSPRTPRRRMASSMAEEAAAAAVAAQWPESDACRGGVSGRRFIGIANVPYRETEVPAYSMEEASEGSGVTSRETGSQLPSPLQHQLYQQHPESKCRSCGGTGVDFMGQPCACRRSVTQESSSENTCRSCGGTGLDFTGRACVCLSANRDSSSPSAVASGSWPQRNLDSGHGSDESPRSGVWPTAGAPVSRPVGSTDTTGAAGDRSTATTNGRGASRHANGGGDADTVISPASATPATSQASPASQVSSASQRQPVSQSRVAAQHVPGRQAASAPAASMASAASTFAEAASGLKSQGSIAKASASAPPAAAAGPRAAAPASAAAPSGDNKSRYTSGLLSLLMRAYAKRGRPPPELCACVSRPPGPAPSVGADGSLSQPPAWETYLKNIACASAHARNCEFADNMPKLQRQVLLLIQEAKAP